MRDPKTYFAITLWASHFTDWVRLRGMYRRTTKFNGFRMGLTIFKRIFLRTIKVLIFSKWPIRTEISKYTYRPGNGERRRLMYMQEKIKRISSILIFINANNNDAVYELSISLTRIDALLRSIRSKDPSFTRLVHRFFFFFLRASAYIYTRLLVSPRRPLCLILPSSVGWMYTCECSFSGGRAVITPSMKRD